MDDLEQLGSLTAEEKEELTAAINSVVKKVVARHAGAESEDLSSALYDAQDFLGGIYINDDENDLEIP